MTIKQKIQHQIEAMLDAKANVILDAIEFAKESRDSDSKSSMGDKYETGRAMMHLEMEKNQGQLVQIRQMQKEVSLIEVEKQTKAVEFGSLVATNNGVYYMSVALGKIIIDQSTYFALSLASPIGQLLHKKKAGDSFSFQGRTWQITAIS